MVSPQKDVSLKNFTTLQIGGPAQYFIEVNTKEELTEALRFAEENSLPFLVIGGGSNLLISDQGFEGLIIKNSIPGIKREGDNFRVSAGVSLQDLVDLTIEEGLDGIYKMTGVPGTVGGAIYGRAGAYGHSITDYLVEVTVYNPKTKEVKTLQKDQIKFGYRDSEFKINGLIILEAVFGPLPKKDQAEIKKEAGEIRAKREAKYTPGTLSPGSFFKNVIAEDLPPNILEKVKEDITPFGKIPAGRLIERVGGKGDKLGQIKIAENHGNTFINLGEGTADDFYNLAKKYFKLVKDEFNIELEPEVQLINLPKLN
jgi:UDP-N-acetylmuramate dehydrogenase